LACSYFEQLEFDNGWKEYEWRKKTKEQKLLKRFNSKPEWNGSNNKGSLLVWGEQGIGDQILHGSILSDLKDFDGQVTVALDKKLLSLFQRTFPEYQFIANSPNLDWGPFDQQISIASLGKFFRRTIEQFKKNSRFLRPDQDTKTRILNTLPKERIICGISWKSINTKIGGRKSICLDDLIPILKMEKRHLVNLQYGDVQSEIEALNQFHQISINSFSSIDKYDDIDSLVALIDSCSYVVTTSNTTAHLSGALGKETLLLLPFSVGKFWYWHHQEGRSIWYPSVKIFQQKQDGDWSEPIKQLKTFLDEKIAI
jgi:ADP-heptose:LPS heptosyltransferase